LAWACDVPVFRYALERWIPDPYEIVIFHRGSPTPDTQSVTNLFARVASANVRLRPIDLSLPLPADLQELRSTAPRHDTIVVRHVRSGAPIWSGPVAPELPGDLLQSPVRREVAERLQSGDSAVWLLLESGNPQDDQAVAALLEEELDGLERTLTLPVEDLDLDIAFSVVRVSRTDPREQVLAQMLLGSEWDLASTDAPMAFPVFGRGRVLYALVGAGITRDNIREACVFLTGPCACEIKDDNPGFDLLMAADWTSNLGELVSTVELPSVASMAYLMGDQSQEDQPAAAADSGRGYTLVYRAGMALLGVMVGVLVVGVLFYRGKR